MRTPRLKDVRKGNPKAEVGDLQAQLEEEKRHYAKADAEQTRRYREDNWLGNPVSQAEIGGTSVSGLSPLEERLFEVGDPAELLAEYKFRLLNGRRHDYFMTRFEDEMFNAFRKIRTLMGE